MTRRAKKTAVARAAVQVVSRYDAAGAGRRMAGWNPPTSGPNRAIVGLQKIRDRARDAARNDWSGASSIQKWTTSLVGVGITPRFKRVKAKDKRQRYTDLWNDFVEQADADYLLDFYGMQTLGVRTWLDGGECFVRRRNRSLTIGLPVPLQVQLLEGDQCPMLDADTYEGLPTGNIIRSGIELNRFGARVAYWFYREHPGDGIRSGTIDASKLVRVLASDVTHVFEPKRPGQLRGVSELSAVLTRLRSTNDYEDAVLERQKLANLFTLFVTRQMALDDGSEDIDTMTGLPIEYDRSGPIARLEPGLAQELEPGEDVKFSNPPEAGTMYSEYMRTTHMATAAGAGLPYEIYSGDIKEISDRTLRVIINEFRRFAEQRQYQIIIPKLCKPVIRWFAEAGVLGGMVDAGDVEDLRRAEWATHGWQHIHPVQDPQGKVLEIEAGLRSRSSAIGERGEDPDAVDEERATDLQREKDLGLYVEPVEPGAPGEDDEQDEDGTDNNEYSAPPNALLRDRLVRAQARALEAQADALRKGQPAPAQMRSVFDRDPVTGLITGVREVPITEE
jgi:lambda family phage portal protein